MKIDKILKKTLTESEKEDMHFLSKQCETLRKIGFNEHQKSERFKWAGIAAALTTFDVFFRGTDSLAANLFNVDFAFPFGSAVAAYLLYLFLSSKKSSQENNELARDMATQASTNYGVTLISSDCIVVRDGETSYFYSLPDMEFYRKSRRMQKNRTND